LELLSELELEDSVAISPVLHSAMKWRKLELLLALSATGSLAHGLGHRLVPKDGRLAAMLLAIQETMKEELLK
jgi:hypothetical protein